MANEATNSDDIANSIPVKKIFADGTTYDIAAKYDINGNEIISSYATLDTNGKVPTSQLPSYVDDVIEAYVVGSTAYASNWLSLTQGGSALTPEIGKIYIIIGPTLTVYLNKQYRWSGSQYTLCNPSDVNSVNGKTGIVTLTADDISDGSTNIIPTATDESNWNAKQEAISDLATIRTGANFGMQGLPYGECSTAKATVAKVVTISGITALTTGLTIAVKMTNASVASATLNLNSLGAYPIYAYGTTKVSGTAGTTGWTAGEFLVMCFNGSGWMMNKAYSADGNTQIRTYMPSSGDVELPILAGSTGTTTAAWTDPASGSYKAAYGAIAMSGISKPTINPSTGIMTIPSLKVGSSDSITGVDTTPTASSTNLVTSGGVKTALDGKVSTTTTVNGHALSSNVTVTKSDLSLGNVDNTSDATKKTNFTGSIASSDTGFVPGGDIYTMFNTRIPACTTSDNGKFLRVVSGAATWSTVANAEDNTF